MAQNQRAGTGALFKNDKQDNEKRPDYTGMATIFNKKFHISAWLTTSRNGVRYMSLAFSENQGANDAGTPNNNSEPQPAGQPPAQTADDASIPF